jgi:4-hydroxy-tetrahydrodipicolinate synthase
MQSKSRFHTGVGQPQGEIMARFGEVLTAMVTPFDVNGAVDFDAAQKLAKWLVENGNDGLVIAGTTGEAPTLSDKEQLDLIKAVCEAVTVPVIAGAGSNDTPHAIHLTKTMAHIGAAGVLSVTPYYNRPSQAGIKSHFAAVAEATELPVILYDIPVRTGRKIDNNILVSLAREHANIVAVKDAANDVSSSARLMAAVPSGFELISGNDDQTLPLLSIGGCGVIGVATHWSGREHKEMITAFKKGDVDHARQVNARLLESYMFETGDLNPNPQPTKAMMRTLGFAVGQCRPPMDGEPADLEDRAKAVWANLRASA